MARTVPDWPRMMKRGLAALYCDLASAAFEREVAAGRLPSPVLLGGEEHWCRRDLDQALDNLTGAGAPDWRSRTKLYAQA
jgi:hypothetical protein